MVRIDLLCKIYKESVGRELLIKDLKGLGAKAIYIPKYGFFISLDLNQIQRLIGKSPKEEFL